MKRILIISFMIFFLVSGQNAFAYNWFDIFYKDFNSQYDLADYSFKLPDDDLKSFSLDAQRELFGLASLYGEINTEIPTLEFAEKLTLSNGKGRYIDYLSDEINNSLNLAISPGIILNADYSEDNEELETIREANVSLEYWVNNKTLIRAEYGQASREWWDVHNITIDEDDVLLDKSDQTNETEKTDPVYNSDSKVLPDEIVDEKVLEEPVYMEEKKEKGRVGISYKTSEKITVSADYVDDDFNADSDFSTILGVQYQDEKGTLWYEYQIDHGNESKQTVTGLELGLNDLATFTASYKLLDTDLLTDSLKKESTWDFGIDFSLSDLSSLSIGYQLKNNEEINLEEEGLQEENKESNIEAQLEIKF